MIIGAEMDYFGDQLLMLIGFDEKSNAKGRTGQFNCKEGDIMEFKPMKELGKALSTDYILGKDVFMGRDPVVNT